MDKEQILEEVRRTAKENGGRSLGTRRFFNETGIRETDWLKFWARWSEAVVEAGFEPNQKTEAYNESDLFDKLTVLIRDLRRFPAARDLKLRARKPDGFPTPETFRRLGDKGEIAARLLKYVEGRPGFDDVVSICAPLATKGSAVQEPGSDSCPSGFGYVYLMKSGHNFKIGATNDIGRRGREIALELPDPAKTIHVIKTDDPFGIEAYWHKRFAAKLKNGEWFELDRNDVAAFRRRKFM